MLSFGMNLQANPPVSRVVEWSKLAEDNGFDYLWLWDSHVLWQEVYGIFALVAANTSRIKMGPCVTNPVTRDPTVTASALATLNEVSGGRMVMGIGRGDSARRVIGKTPVTVDRMEWACRLIRDLAAGREVDFEGTKLQLKWSLGHEVEIWVAAYGPKALRATGRVADGLIMQLADPYIIEWSLPFVREGAEEAGRRFEDIRVQVVQFKPMSYLGDGYVTVHLGGTLVETMNGVRHAYPVNESVIFQRFSFAQPSWTAVDGQNDDGTWIANGNYGTPQSTAHG